MTRHMFNPPWVGKIPRGGHSKPLQYSWLENPMDRGARRLLSTGSHRVRQDWSDLAYTAYNYIWYQAYDILEKAKLWRQQKNQQLPGMGSRDNRWVQNNWRTDKSICVSCNCEFMLLEIYPNSQNVQQQSKSSYKLWLCIMCQCRFINYNKYNTPCACSYPSVISVSLQPFGPSPTRLLCSWNFSGKNIGMGCHFLLQGIFPIQGLNPYYLCLLHCRQIL